MFAHSFIEEPEIGKVWYLKIIKILKTLDQPPSCLYPFGKLDYGSGNCRSPSPGVNEISLLLIILVSANVFVQNVA